MSQWTLGEVRLSKRVSVKVEIECGGQLDPGELLAVARLLEWIARATRKWQAGVRAVTPDGKQGSKATRAKGAAASEGSAAVRMEGEADASTHVRTNGDAALQEAGESPQAADAVDPSATDTGTPTTRVSSSSDASGEPPTTAQEQP